MQHNRTVFAISYRNATAEMSGVKMDDYLLNGPKQALDVISDITGADTVDIVGLCLGGALTAITAAYLAASGDERVGNLTLLNTMLDYSDPGELKLFTDAKAVERLEQKMAKTGYLDGVSMAGTFDMLRANDLIFNYVVSNWLLGQSPPAFDILAWNADSTRMPAAMHGFYLRKFYVENSVISGDLELAGRRIALGDIKHNVYVVSAENDHIVPWRSGYATTQLVARSGAVRAEQRRAHRRDREPARSEELVLDVRRRPCRPRRMAARHNPQSGFVVGGLGGHGRRRTRATSSTRRRWAAIPTRALCDAPGTYIST